MTINPTGKQIKALAVSEMDGPVIMLNLLRFKPDGGAELYSQYLEAAAPHLRAVGAQLLFHGSAKAVVIGEEDEWDSVVLVRYPTKQAFLAIARAGSGRIGP